VTLFRHEIRAHNRTVGREILRSACKAAALRMTAYYLVNHGCRQLRASMDIEDWRKKIDEIDCQLVRLISQRARAAVEIGRLKRNTALPIYEPDRERIVFENVQSANQGPLPGRDLVRIYERIIDVMRNIQKEEIAPVLESRDRETEMDSEVND